MCSSRTSQANHILGRWVDLAVGPMLWAETYHVHIDSFLAPDDAADQQGLAADMFNKDVTAKPYLRLVSCLDQGAVAVSLLLYACRSCC